jgi:hypothetical protein
MHPLRLLVTVAFAAAAATSFAQTTSQTESRGSLPPPEGRDAAPPANAESKDSTRERDAVRCDELTGALREQCLRDRSSAVGASGTPLPPSLQRDPVVEPPPQNPRQPR